MGKLVELLEAQKAGCALDGVDGAENLVDERLVVRRLLQLQKVIVEPFENLACLHDEALDDLSHVFGKNRM